MARKFPFREHEARTELGIADGSLGVVNHFAVTVQGAFYTHAPGFTGVNPANPPPLYL